LREPEAAPRTAIALGLAAPLVALLAVATLVVMLLVR
jgi:hypothetical protein